MLKVYFAIAKPNQEIVHFLLEKLLQKSPLQPLLSFIFQPEYNSSKTCRPIVILMFLIQN